VDVQRFLILVGLLILLIGLAWPGTFTARAYGSAADTAGSLQIFGVASRQAW
jgi:hypothetical protein